LLQDLGFLSFTLPEVEIPHADEEATRCGATLEQQRANQRAPPPADCGLSMSKQSVKRCRIVKTGFGLWKEGVRDLVMEICCALHNFRVRLTTLAAMA